MDIDFEGTHMTTTTIRGASRLARVVLVGAAGLALAGCGALAETAAEQIAEEAVEAGGGEGANVGIDPDTGELNIEVEGSEGGSINIGGGEVPDDFPAEFVLPEDHQVRGVTELQGQVSVQVTAGAVGLEAFEATKANLADAGWESVAESTTGDLHSASFENGEQFVTVGALGQGEEYVLTFNYGAQE